MTGKYLFDVFGGLGIFAKASNHLGLRGHVLDTKFGAWYEVTKPLILTRIRQDVPAGKCVAGMISLSRQLTSCSSKVISTKASIANLLHRARMPWFLEHPCGSPLWDVPKIKTLAAQPRTARALADVFVFGSPCRQRTLFLVWNVDSKDAHRIAGKCAGTGGRCTVSEETCSSKGFRLALRVWIFT